MSRDTKSESTEELNVCEKMDVSLKLEPHLIKIKEEPADDYVSSSIKNESKSEIDSFFIKKESNYYSDIKDESLDSKPIKREPGNINNGHVFDNVNIKPENLCSLDLLTGNNNNASLSSRKSTKLSVFIRNNPYEPNHTTNSSDLERPSAKSRLGGYVEEPSLKSRLGAKNTKKKIDYERDPEVLERRQKQIDYGKNTVGYDNYIQKIPKYERLDEDPKTPRKEIKYSRRAWDGLIRQWRIQLHEFDNTE